MPVREGPAQPPPPPKEPYPADQARGADNDLRTPGRRMLFVGGLIAFVVLVFILKAVS